MQMQSNLSSDSMISERQPLFLFFLLTILVTAFLSNDLYLPSMPHLAGVFNTSNNLIQFSLSTWFLGNMLLQLYLGPLADVYGRRKVMLYSCVLLFISSLIAGFSTNIWLFLVMRCIQGVSVSGILIASLATINEQYTDPIKCTKILGYVGMCTSLAPILGPMLGGQVFVHLGWQANFYIISLLSLLCLLGLNSVMPETLQNKLEKLQFKKILADYLLLFKNPKYIYPTLSYSLLFSGGSAFITGAAYVFIDLLKLSPETMGFALQPIVISYSIGAFLSGHASKILGQRLAIKIGIIFILLPVTSLLIIAWIYGPSLLAVISFISLYYFGLGIACPPLNQIALANTDMGKGIAAALLTFLMMMFCTLSSFIVSIIYNGSIMSVISVITIDVYLGFIALQYFKTKFWKLNV